MSKDKGAVLMDHVFTLTGHQLFTLMNIASNVGMRGATSEGGEGGTERLVARQLSEYAHKKGHEWLTDVAMLDFLKQWADIMDLC